MISELVFFLSIVEAQKKQKNQLTSPIKKRKTTTTKQLLIDMQTSFGTKCAQSIVEAMKKFED